MNNITPLSSVPNVLPNAWKWSAVISILRKRKNIWYDLGRLYFDFRDYENAIPYLKSAFTEYPCFPLLQSL